MKIRFSGDCAEAGNGLEVSLSGNEGTIAFQEKIHFFRGLGLLVEVEAPQFTMNGSCSTYPAMPS